MDELIVTPPGIIPERQARTWVKPLYKRVRNTAKELWIEDVAIALHCMKCNETLVRVSEDPIILRCKCRERTVR
jgi:hypothetical protein